MKLKDLTPEDLICTIGACPAVRELPDGRLLIVGKEPRDIREVGLLNIGHDERAIVIDRALLAKAFNITMLNQEDWDKFNAAIEDDK